MLPKKKYKIKWDEMWFILIIQKIIIYQFKLNFWNKISICWVETSFNGLLLLFGRSGKVNSNNPDWINFSFLTCFKLILIELSSNIIIVI